MLLQPNLIRVIYLELLLMAWGWDALLNYLQPEQNAGLWLSAFIGAFIIRFARPNLPAKEWLFGLIVGYLTAIQFAPDIIAAGGLGFIKRPEGVYGATALIADLIIQLIAFIIRLSGKVGDNIYDNPGEAFDGTIDRVEKVAGLWMRIKVPLMDFINQFFSKKS